MGRPGGGARGLAWLLAGTLSAAAGCASCLHPVAPIGCDTAARCAAIPQICRNHVYVFLIDGEDPLDLANLAGVRDAIISMGYIKTYRGQYHHAGYFEDEIRRIHGADDTARFVVMGFGLGANAARDVAEAVRPDGAPIDLLVYCGGVALPNALSSRPVNAQRIVHIVGQGADAVAVALDGAENVQLPDTDHFGSPTHSYTLDLLGRELTEAASRVPVTGAPAADPGIEGGAPPRAIAAREAMARDEWDFLRPPPAAPHEAPVEMPKAP
jgi:hypothetical protein